VAGNQYPYWPKKVHYDIEKSESGSSFADNCAKGGLSSKGNHLTVGEFIPVDGQANESTFLVPTLQTGSSRIDV
jgi:hypothetical protein